MEGPHRAELISRSGFDRSKTKFGQIGIDACRVMGTELDILRGRKYRYISAVYYLGHHFWRDIMQAMELLVTCSKPRSSYFNLSIRQILYLFESVGFSYL